VTNTELIAQLEAAHDEVSRICKERWAGHHGWRTSIPARPDYDSDLVIGGALRAASRFVRALATEQERKAP
jgi:hypothetical protein